MERRLTRRQMGKWFVVGLILALVLGTTPPAAYAQDPTPAPPSVGPAFRPVPESVRVDTSVSPSGVLLPGSDGRMKILLRGQPSPDCYGLPIKPVDAVVVMDTSPSAGRPSPLSNFGRAQLILQSLWEQMNQPIYGTDAVTITSSRLAIITVDAGITTPDEVNVRLPFTNTSSAITTTIAGLQNGADSGFDKGIHAAAQLLREQARPEAARALIILFHDNYFAKQEVVQQEVNSAKKLADVFVLGNRLYVRAEEQVTETDATNLAGSADHVLLDPSAADLRRLFVTAAEGQPNAAGRALSVYHELPDPSPFEIRGSDIEAGGALQGNRIVWRPAAVLAPGLELGYTFRLASSANGSFNAAVGVTYLDCNGFLHAYAQGDGTVVGTPVAQQSVQVATPTGQPAAPVNSPTPVGAGPVDGTLSTSE